MFGVDQLTLTSIFGAVIVSLIVRSIFRALRDPVRDVPGPNITRFTNLWYLRRAANGSFPWVNIDLHKKYGPVVRIAPREYSIDDLDAAKIIYSADSKFFKSSWYDGWVPPDPNMWKDLFSTRDAKIHAAHKKTLAPFYTMTSLTRMEFCVDETIALIVNKFNDLAREDREFDLQHWLQCYAFDTIMLITVNKRFGFLDDGDDKGMFNGIEQFNTMATSGGFYPYIEKPILWLLWHLNLPTPLDFAVELIDGRIREHKAKRDQQSSDEDTGLKDKQNTNLDSSNASIFARAMAVHLENPKKLPVGAIHTMGMQNLGAGSDTTSISLSSTIHQLYRAPMILDRLRSEIASARKENNIPDESYLPFTVAQKLPYLQAVCKEATRLHAATGLPMSRVVPAGGATLAGTFFPAGVVVGINSWVAHYNPTIYGDDPAEFRPERWLPMQTFPVPATSPDKLPEAEKDRLARMEQYYLAFGKGSRSCVGRNISMLEITKLIPELVWRFDFEAIGFTSVDENGKTKRDRGGRDGSGLETRGTWFVKQTNLRYRVKVRS